jgi:ATPase subunit of ABC transporter with duplicated ATPase domains
MSLRADEYIPEWLSKLIMLVNNYRVFAIASQDDMKEALLSLINEPVNKVNRDSNQAADLDIDARKLLSQINPKPWTVYNSQKSIKVAQKMHATGTVLKRSKARSPDGFGIIDREDAPDGEPLIEMKGVHVAYGDKSVLGNWTQTEDGSSRDGLWWTICRGQRWGVFGPNGEHVWPLLFLGESHEAD